MMQVIIIMIMIIPITYSKPLITPTFTFLSIGDWGCQYRRGHRVAKRIAKHMATTHPTPSFIVSTGDNFYENGVRSMTSRLFTYAYTSVFMVYPSLQRRWYQSLGNHDHRGSIKAQIQYSRDVNPLFYLPHAYYDDILTNDDVSMHLIVLDTTAIVRSYDHDDKQIQWLHHVLQTAGDDITWRVVVGHHPIFSHGEHGTTSILVSLLRPILQQYSVNMYLSGHDHDMQLFTVSDDTILYAGSGGGCKHVPLSSSSPKFRRGLSSNDTHPVTLLAEDKYGYMSHTVSTSSIITVVYDGNGRVLYNITRS